MKKPSQFDAIVVGAGPSGNACAYTLAKAGLKVLQIERGEYPGSKNVQGAILYSDALEKIIPDFRDDAPLERHIIEQRMWMMDDDSFVGTHYRSDDYNKPPYNRYTIIRAQFDKWFSSKVREAGALLICETTVNHLIMDGDQVVGVQCDREAGDVYADVVIMADGVNSTLARKAGFHGEIKDSNVALAVKEILFMPEDTIRQRFNIGEEEGVVIEMVGKITDGMMGTGFLYTNKESLTIGIGCMPMIKGGNILYGEAADLDESTRTIHRAIDLGVTFFDTAQIYGPFSNEELLGEAIKGKRDGLVKLVPNPVAGVVTAPVASRISSLIKICSVTVSITAGVVSFAQQTPSLAGGVWPGFRCTRSTPRFCRAGGATLDWSQAVSSKAAPKSSRRFMPCPCCAQVCLGLIVRSRP